MLIMSLTLKCDIKNLNNEKDFQMASFKSNYSKTCFVTSFLCKHWETCTTSANVDLLHLKHNQNKVKIPTKGTIHGKSTYSV